MNHQRKRDAERLERALGNLTRRIQAGEEFPDACWAVASRDNVPYEKLQAAYDQHCIDTMPTAR